MFKFFRNLIPDNYVKGYLDGYADAQAEFVHIAENLDVAYWQGYNSAMVDVSTNDDINQMSANDDIDNDGWYTDGITYMTDKHIIDRWNELFDANPWLVGMTYDGDCESISCCPYPEPQDWLVFSEITTLMWLANLQDSPVLTKGLIENFGGTQ